MPHPRPMHRPAMLLMLAVALLLLAGCTTPVRVEWDTETEMNTAGFNLYRSESIDGPFDLKVNPQLIPATGDAQTGSKYSFTDRSAATGVTYHYQLQEVERTGGTNTFGPITVRAGGFGWQNALVLVVLALAVLGVWIFGAKPAMRRRD